MLPLTEHVEDYIRRHALLSPGDRVGVAVSGGADSVALLRVLLEVRGELGIVLSVVHFNHQIRGDAANSDEQFVRDLAAQHGLKCHVSSGPTPSYAKEHKLSLETAARELRYAYFRSLICDRDNRLDKIATAHTLDDQAETVLMRILRGTGPGGLAGIYPVVTCRPLVNCPGPGTLHGSHPDRQSAPSASIVRPLLDIRRTEIEQHLKELHQPWRTDATNADLKHTRNRVRHELMPVLEREFNPALRERLSEMAEIARAEEAFWEEQVNREVERLVAAATPPRRLELPESELQLSLHLDMLMELPLAMQRRVIRAAARTLGLALDFREVDRILYFAGDTRAKTVQLHDRWFASQWNLYAMRVPHDLEGRTGIPRSGRTLLFHRLVERHLSREGYEYGFSTPGEIKVAETGTLFRARLVTLDSAATDRIKQRDTPGTHSEPGYNRYQLLNPALLSSELLVRSWRPGDRFWPAHTSSPKKVKELLQKRHVTGQQRACWPVVLSGDEIVWMRGFPVPEKYRAQDGAETALLIEEVLENGKVLKNV
ncbi:MAG TPA: tRNA lysidine(34) synthetase TilS [Terriglobales bacterium]|nr:tRNA lysidine(34) synthetase TilS [Terriglobales bacterium]